MVAKNGWQNWKIRKNWRKSSGKIRIFEKYGGVIEKIEKYIGEMGGKIGKLEKVNGKIGGKIGDQIIIFKNMVAKLKKFKNICNQKTEF